MRLILATRLLMTRGATFSGVYELQLHRNARPSGAVAAPSPSAGHRRQTRLGASSAQPGGRPREERGCQGATPACCACAVTRQRLPAGRTHNAARPIRRPQGARPRPRPPSPLPSLVSILPPTEAGRSGAPLSVRAPTRSGARAQRRSAGLGREGRAGVRPCVRLRQRARRRERARGKGGSGRGGSASCGYVVELVGSGSSFTATAASRHGVSARERDCPYARRTPSTAELARSSVGASRPSSPEGGGEAILSRPTPRNRAERLGEAAEPRSPPSEAPVAATVGGLPRRGRSQVARALSSPRFSHASPVLRPENARVRSWL